NTRRPGIIYNSSPALRMKCQSGFATSVSEPGEPGDGAAVRLARVGGILRRKHFFLQRPSSRPCLEMSAAAKRGTSRCAFKLLLFLESIFSSSNWLIVTTTG